MRFTKLEFIAAMDRFHQMYDEERRVSEVMGIWDPDWVCGKWIWDYYDMIHTMCDLDGDDGWDALDFFVFTLDFGKDYEPGIYEVDDIEIPLATVEDLWNALTAK